MSCILRPIGRASSSSLPLARSSVSSLPRRSLHISPRLSSSPSSSPSPKIEAPPQIKANHPYLAARLAVANLARNPSTINVESYQSLSNELLLLRGCDNFFQKYHSPLLWDAFNAVKTKDQFREALELIKVWRMEGGAIDWRMGRKVVELSLEHQTPLWALKTLMHPIAFGIHLFSPSLPPLVVPTSPTLLTPDESTVHDFWLKTTTLSDSDLRDRKAHLPNLPRTNPYILNLPPRVQPVQTVEDLALSVIPLDREPVCFKNLVEVLLGPVSEENGKERELTLEEATFLRWQGQKLFPQNGVLTARWLSWLKTQEATEKTKKAYLWAQNELGEVEQLVFEGQEELEEEVVKALVEGAEEETEWPLYVRTKELLEGKKLEVEGEERGFTRVLGEGMGGLIGAKEGGEEEVKAEEENVEEEKAI